MKSLTLLLAVSFAIGIMDDLAFLFNLGLLSSNGELLMAVSALIWAGMFFLAVQSLGWRALWLLISLPLFLLPFVGAVLGAGMI